ncbi:phytanoyl-CoA dioxygenase family protein [Sphingomonas koreensis]
MTHDPSLAATIEETRATLAATGWCIVRGVLPATAIAALDAELAPIFAKTPFCRGGFYGETTKRFGRLLARSQGAAQLVQHPLIQGVAEAALAPWCDTIQLNVAQAIAIHPGAPAQFPHRDQSMWGGPPGEIEYLVNVIWPLVRFREDNGATRLWPGSHAAKALAESPSVPGIAAEMDPGDALIFLGSTLHGAGANRSDKVRRGIVIGYSLGWLKPYENPWLAYPPPVARHFPPALAALAGYRQHRPNLGNYDGQCPSVLLGDHDGGPLAATDALLPEQTEAVAAHLAGQAPRS